MNEDYIKQLTSIMEKATNAAVDIIVVEKGCYHCPAYIGDYKASRFCARGLLRDYLNQEGMSE